MPGLYRARSQAGLVWLVYPRWFGLREALSGAVGTLRSSALLRGNALESTATSANGIRFPFSSLLRAVKNDCTIILGAELDSATDYGALWGVPAAAGTWTDPYYAFALLKNANLNAMRFHTATGGTGFDGQNSSDNSELVYDGTYHVYAVTRSGAALKFYVDGVARGTATLVSNLATVFPNETEVVLLERSTTSAGEGTDGRLHFAALFNRALSAGEMAALSEAPAAALLRRVNVSASVPVEAQPTARRSPPRILRPRPTRDAHLQFLFFPRHYGWADAVTRRMPSALEANAALDGGSLASASASGSGVVYRPPTARLIARDFTLLWYGRIDAKAVDAQLVYLPGAGYEGVSFSGSSAHSEAYLTVEGVGGYQYASSGTGYLTASEPQLYAVTCAEGAVTFYRDGAAFAVGSITPTLPAAPNSVNISQGLAGLTLLAAVFNRALGPAEIAAIAREPNALVRSVARGAVESYAPPTASLTTTPASGAAPLTATFALAVTSGGPWSGTLTIDDAYGTTYPVSSAGAASIVHTFDTPGTYTAALTVANAFGQTTISAQVTVLDAAAAPIAQIAFEPAAGTAPLTVQFRDVSAGGAASARAWDFTGDGTTDSTFANPQFTYAVGGTYTARLRVSNAYGASEAAAVIVVAAAPVSPPPPIGVTPDAVTYHVELDFGRDGTFAHPLAGITSRVLRASWGMGMSAPMQTFAEPSRALLALDNSDGAWHPEQTTAAYRGLLAPGVLLRIRAAYDGETHTLWTGKVAQISAAPGDAANASGGWREVLVEADDAMGKLLDAEYAPRLLLNVRTDQAIRAFFDASPIGWPYDRDWFRLDVSRLNARRLYKDLVSRLEVGRTTLAFAGDNLDRGRGVAAQTYLREMVAAEAGGRLFWNGRTGTFDFHNRYHDGPGPALAVLGGDLLTGAAAAFAEDLANVVTVQFQPRAVGAPGTLLWQIDEPFTLRPGQERTLTARFRDAVSRDARVSALVVLPVQPGDLVANELASARRRRTDSAAPLGRDVSDQMGTFVEAGASSARVTVRNPTAASVLVSTLALRGTPLTVYEQDAAVAADADSIEAFDRRDALLPLRAIDDPELAAGIAGLHLRRHKDAVNRWRTAELRAGWRMRDAANAAALTQLLRRTVGDRVRLQEEWSGHDAEYFIVGEQHRVDAASGTHAVTWTLKSASVETWFRLNASRLNGSDGLPL